MTQITETAIATTKATTDRQPLPPKTDPLTRKCRYIIAAVLTWDTQREVSSDEIITIAIADDILWVKLTNNRAVPIHVDVFRGIRRQQLEQQARVEAEMDVARVLEQSSASSSEHWNQNDIEVDNDEHPSAPTYRVWKSWHFMGSFHQSPVDGLWLTSPTFGRDYNRYATPKEAVSAIATAWNHAQQLRTADQAVAL